MSKRVRSRNYCFTSFVVKDLEATYNEYSDIIRYICWGEEICPKTQKKHLQGWVQFFNPKDLKPAQKILGLGNIHMEKMNGSEYDNEKYCKKDGKYKSFGKFITQGYRTDLEAIKKKIFSPNFDKEDLIHDHFETYCRYRNGINDTIEIAEKNKRKKFRKVEVEYCHGETGTGKTKYGTENTQFKITGDSLKWWDGYNGEKSILIDEYDNNIPVTNLLNILDGYCLRLPVKGSFTYANWTKVIITSNLEPDELHANAKPKHREALFRRINKITNMSRLARGNTQDPSESDLVLVNLDDLIKETNSS